MRADLDRLIGRLRSEAGIDIRVGTDVGPASTEQASITVEVIRKSELQRVVPQAACFVAPNVSSWAEYKRARTTARTACLAISSFRVVLPGAAP